MNLKRRSKKLIISRFFNKQKSKNIKIKLGITKELALALNESIKNATDFDYSSCDDEALNEDISKQEEDIAKGADMLSDLVEGCIDWCSITASIKNQPTKEECYEYVTSMIHAIQHIIFNPAQPQDILNIYNTSEVQGLIFDMIRLSFLIKRIEMDKQKVDG